MRKNAPAYMFDRVLMRLCCETFDAASINPLVPDVH